MDTELVVVLDFGGQYNQLIARRVRELSVYSEMHPFDIPYEELLALKPKGIILSGGPASVYMPEAPRCDPRIFSSGIPVLGICYGMQLLAQELGGKVEHAELREYGKCHFKSDGSILFDGLPEEQQVWMSHGLSIAQVPPGFVVSGRTDNCAVASMSDTKRNLFGVQFHPEVRHTPCGNDILRNFLF